LNRLPHLTAVQPLQKKEKLIIENSSRRPLFPTRSI
jgi:hypothetical protein